MQNIRDLIIADNPNEAMQQLRFQWSEMAATLNTLLTHMTVSKSGKVTSDTYKTKIIQVLGNPPRGATSPTQVYLNYTSGWQMKVNDELYWGFVLPPDWVPGTNITFDLHGYSSNTTAARYIQFNLGWEAVAIGETITSPGSSGVINSGDILLPTTANQFQQTAFTSISGASLASGDHVFFKLTRVTSTGTAPATPADDPVILHFEVNYTAYVTDP